MSVERDWKDQLRLKLEEVLTSMEKDNQGKKFSEIEELAERYRQELGLDLLRGGLMSQPQTNPQGEYFCPRCGRKLRIQNKAQGRTLGTRLGEMEYHRPYGVCDHCQYTGAPLDEALGIPRTGPSIGAREKICHAAAATRSFKVASDVLKVQAGIELSRQHVRTIAEEEGRILVEEETEKVKRFEKGELEVKPEQTPQLIIVTCDGGRLQSRDFFKENGKKDKSHENKEEKGRKKKDRWKEDKIGVIYSAIARPDQNAAYGKYKGAEAQTKTYCATMQPWERFGWMLRMEAEARGYIKAKVKLFLADGAKHIRDLKDLQFPEAIFILDWPHAAGHLSNSAKAAFGEGTKEADDWYAKHKLMLWNGKRDDLIADLRQLSERVGPPKADDPDTHPRKTVHRDAFSYFPENYEAINYPVFRQKGWPIGSGVAEAAVKQFALRLKGSEKFWNVWDTNGRGTEKIWTSLETGAEEMLAMCTLYYCEDDRWNQYWRRRSEPNKRE